VKEGGPLPLSGQWVSKLVTAAIEAGSSLLAFVDARLTEAD
jgi:hypothetical protein